MPPLLTVSQKFRRVPWCLAGGLLASLTLQPAGAQRTPEPATFELSAVQLGNAEIPPLYVAKPSDPSSKDSRAFQSFPVPQGSRGQPLKLPLSQPAMLYTGTVGPNGKADGKPYLEIPAKAPGDRLLVIFHLDAKGQPKHTFLDDSAAAHPPGTVRVANLSQNRLIFVAGGSAVSVPAGGEAKTVPVTDAEGRFPFGYVIETGRERLQQTPVQALRFRSPDQRLLVVYSTLPLAKPDSTGDNAFALEPGAVRLYDLLRSPTAAASVAGTSAPAAGTGARAASDESIELIALGGALAEPAAVSWDGPNAPSRTPVRPDEFARLSAPPAAEAKLRLASGEPIGPVRLSGNSRQHLVILAPADSGDRSPEVFAIENSVQSHPLGATRLFNLTPYQVGYSSGSEAAYIDPKQDGLVNFPTGASTVKLAVKTPGGWKIVPEAVPTRSETSRRNFAFVYKVPGKEEFAFVEKTQ